MSERDTTYLKLIDGMKGSISFIENSLRDIKKQPTDLTNELMNAMRLKHYNKRLESSKEALAWLIKRYENL